MDVVDKLNMFKEGLIYSGEKLREADPDGDIIFLRKFKKSSEIILERVNETLLILKEDKKDGR